jgi:hypothetical protein
MSTSDRDRVLDVAVVLVGIAMVTPRVEIVDGAQSPVVLHQAIEPLAGVARGSIVDPLLEQVGVG